MISLSDDTLEQLAWGELKSSFLPTRNPISTADLRRAGRFRKATPRRGRAMNKAVVFRPACRAVVQGSASLPPGRRGKTMLHMRLASPTSPAHVAAYPNS
jgi:hypothetical protein